MVYHGQGFGELGVVLDVQVSEAKAPAQLGAKLEKFKVQVGPEGEVKAVVDGLQLEEAVVHDLGFAAEVVGGVKGSEHEPAVVADALRLPFELDRQAHQGGFHPAGVPVPDSGGAVDPVDQQAAFARHVGGVNPHVEVGAEANVGNDAHEVAGARLGNDVVDALGPGGRVLHGEVELADSEKKAEVQRLLVKARKVGRLPEGRRRKDQSNREKPGSHELRTAKVRDYFRATYKLAMPRLSGRMRTLRNPASRSLAAKASP